MSIPRELSALVEMGYFDKVVDGDGRASGLFTRLAAYALNPNGDPNGWGCLRKTGGGKNIEGYSEDAIVLGNDPNNLHNVRDIIGGAGAPGARLNWGDGFVNRRTSDIWEAPVALNAEQLAYLKPGGEVPGPSPTPTPTPVPTPTPAPECRYQPVDIGAALSKLDEALSALSKVQVEVLALRLEAQDVRAALRNGLAINAAGTGSVDMGWAGKRTVSAAITGTAKG